VNDAIRLDIRIFRRQGFLRANTITSGEQRWHAAHTREQRGCVSLTVDLSNPMAGFVLVQFRLNGEPRTQRIQLASRAMPYGGRRYYFICPKRQCRCEVLPMADGVFASRQAQRLTYQSQSNSPIDRMQGRARRLEAKLRPANGKPVPRGRNRERIADAYERAQTAFEQAFSQTIMNRWGLFLEA
jgi:hypothetical protein